MMYDKGLEAEHVMVIQLPFLFKECIRRPGGDVVGMQQNKIFGRFVTLGSQIQHLQKTGVRRARHEIKIY